MLEQAKQELATAWLHVKKTEKYGLAFGRLYLEWSQRLTPAERATVCEDLDIDLNIAGWWAERYAEEAGLKQAKAEKRINRSTPPDSFEYLRKLAISMLNLGFQKMWSEGQGDRSHLSAAKAWAYGRIKAPEEVKQ